MVFESGDPAGVVVMERDILLEDSNNFAQFFFPALVC